MKKISLNDNTPIYCLKTREAIVLDEHIKGYLSYGININPDDIIIDIGANIGVFGIRLSKMYPNITLHCFEPIPQIYEVLKQNSILSKNDNFHTYLMGISNRNQNLEFTYYPNSPALSTSKPETWQQDKSNFYSAIQGNISNAPEKFWWAKLIPKFITPMIAKYLTYNSKNITSPVIQLSNFISKHKINKINLMKIDCEGEELNVLLGIKKMHWKLIQNIIIEVNNINSNTSKIKKILNENGFLHINIEKEKGFENSKLVNIYASKTNY